MIEPRPPLVERLSAVQVRELSDANDCAPGTPSDALERTCVLVKDWVRAEQILVPRHTPFKARNRQRHVSNRRELRHLSFLRFAPRGRSECYLCGWQLSGSKSYLAAPVAARTEAPVPAHPIRVWNISALPRTSTPPVRRVIFTTSSAENRKQSEIP